MTTTPAAHVNVIMRDGPARSLAVALVDAFCDVLAASDTPGLGLSVGQVQSLEDTLAAVFERELSPAQADELVCQAGYIAAAEQEA